MSQDQNLSPVEIFLKSWQVYQEIIQHNYMFHREISASARTAFEKFSQGKTLNMLDIGCGDSSMALPLLATDKIKCYKGCDLSQPALTIATKQLSTLDISFELQCDNMLHFMSEQAEASTDLLLASYSIHHLDTKEKQQLIFEAARVLSPGGHFLLIDIFREAHEDHADYIENYVDRLRNTWTNLSSTSQDLVIDHATQYDFPECPAFYTNLFEKNGFDTGERLAKCTWHEAWLFTKQDLAY